eukprot:803049_1
MGIKDKQKKRSMGSPLFTCIFPPLHNFAEHFSMFIPPLLQYIIIQGLRAPKYSSKYPTEFTDYLYLVESQHCFDNYKIKRTYHKYGCKANGIDNCCLHHSDAGIIPFELAPSPIPITRHNNDEHMKYLPFNISNKITADNIENYSK